ncbi:putative nuclease HARBI1 [Orussus abietinus]|uniref:putative nuclease HARBI1 n=1 Tax=Orussus abietinus TaxID=222816 RepID=UPI000C715B26|nr:putative nuclease HARBI1 [Orussus abietinus]
MEFHYNRGERRTWLIGDAGYPLEPWLLTPLPHYPQWSRQFQYNEQLCKARSIVERFFGVWKGTWRCLSYQRVLMYDSGMAGKICNACAVLHNMRLHYRLPIEEDWNEPVRVPANDLININLDGCVRGLRAIADRIQKLIF